jgi:ketosteroid isomerase-like protein
MLATFITIAGVTPCPGAAQNATRTDSTRAGLGDEENARQVFAAERAFAATMGERDFEAFKRFLDEGALFFGPGPLSGPDAIASAWEPFFDGSTPPFTWEPTRVVVFGGGDLAYSTGPVTAADGTQSGTFHSIWRRTPGGEWRVVFDRGDPSP